MTPAELYRLLMNLIRFGIVEQVDLSTLPHKARVKTGELLTEWLPWVTQRAGDARTSWPLTVGEQVVLLAPGGDIESAVILAALNQQAIPAPSSLPHANTIEYPDNAFFQYDPDSGALVMRGVKTVTIEAAETITATTQQATIKASSTITLDTPNVICTHHLSTATLSVEKGGTMSGNITHEGGQLSSNGVVVDGHTHGNVRSGSDRTGGPQ